MSKYKFILIVPFILFLAGYFILTSKEVYYYCNKSNCISIVVNTKGKLTYFNVYDRRIYSRLFLNTYPHAEFPADIPIGILHGELNNKKIIVVSEGEPTFKGNLNKNIEFRTTLYIGDNNKDVIHYYNLESMFVNDFSFNHSTLQKNVAISYRKNLENI